MANVLSQKEIDELLINLKSGNMQGFRKPEMKKESVKKYDFRMANKFTKDQLKSINAIFENYARLLVSFYTGTLRASCEIELISIEELKYYEFTNSLPTLSFFGIIGMTPLTGSSLISISPQIAYAMINRVLGGNIKEDNTLINFTEIELVIMERLLRQMISLMDEAWQKVVPTNSTLERIETNPQYVQIVSANEPIAIVTMNVKINEMDGFIHFCLPHIAIKPVEKNLNVRSIYSNKQESKDTNRRTTDIKESLKGTTMELIACFDITYTSIRDCLNLQEGDVLVLDHNVEKPINLYVQHIPKFKGKIGVKDNKYSIQITSIENREERTNERNSVTGRN